jgi:hypothetical protein
MKTSEATTNILKALIQVQGQMPTFHKDATNPFHRNKYLTLHELMQGLRPLLTKQGLVLSQGSRDTQVLDDNSITITIFSRIWHVQSSEWVESELVMPLAQTSAQGAGSASTYGRRYTLSALLGIVADDDDDGNSASASPVQRRQPVSQGVQTVQPLRRP